jgi:hypothetical protein
MKFYDQASHYAEIINSGVSNEERQRTIQEHMTSLKYTMSELKDGAQHPFVPSDATLLKKLFAT